MLRLYDKHKIDISKRHANQQTVEAVEESTMTRHDIATILNSNRTF